MLEPPFIPVLLESIVPYTRSSLYHVPELKEEPLDSPLGCTKADDIKTMQEKLWIDQLHFADGTVMTLPVPLIKETQVGTVDVFPPARH